MGTVSWVLVWSNELQRTGMRAGLNGFCHRNTGRKRKRESREHGAFFPLYVLELSGYVIVLTVFQYLRQTGDNVSHDVHRCHWHQLHQFSCQLLQVRIRTEVNQNVIVEVEESKRIRTITQGERTSDGGKKHDWGDWVHCKTQHNLSSEKMTTLLSTTLSSHLSWVIIRRGMLSPPSLTLWTTEGGYIC